MPTRGSGPERRKLRITIATTHGPFVHGGAEMLAEDLLAALRARGHEADLLEIPWRWHPAEHVLRAMLATRVLELRSAVDLVIALKFPAFLIRHPQKILWIVHQHRAAYDLWDHSYGLIHDPRGAQVRAAIQVGDRRSAEEAFRVATISGTVAGRLKESLGIEAEVLHPPPRPQPIANHGAACGPYLFFPSRLDPMKRQALVLRALACCRQAVEVRFAGSAHHPTLDHELRQLAESLGVAHRVRWLGRRSEIEIAAAYRQALGVLFPPHNEDYGYVTLEAMLHSKPVVTCSDSGEPATWVRHEVTGLVTEPTAEALATAMDRLWLHRDEAVAWGRAARRLYDELDLGWPALLDRLLADVETPGELT